MPVDINGMTYFRTAEVCKAAGISKVTFLRWIRRGSFSEVEQRDRHGWRIFSRKEMAALVTQASRTLPGK
jgi:predicted site-specific integrase-resolvase